MLLTIYDVIPIISEINLTKTLGRIISLPKNSLPLLDESPNLLPETNYLKLNLLLKDILSEKEMKIKLIEKKMNEYGFHKFIPEFKTRFNDYENIIMNEWLK